MNTLDQKADAALGSLFDKKLDELIAAAEKKKTDAGIQLSNADRVTPEAKHKLSGILKHYAKDPHPFAACVRDNRKRFGPKTEGVCAVLKDIIRGTTKWRGKDNPNDKGAPGVKGLSEMPEHLLMDDDTYRLVSLLAENDLWELLGLADICDEGEKSLTLDYPLAAPERPQVTEKDKAFLNKLHDHHASRLKLATAYATNKDAHPDVASFANDTVSDSTRQLTRINRMLKTGSPYG